MIDLVKVYGLPNSGTTYATELLARNNFSKDVAVDTGGVNDRVLGWKHGYPKLRPHTLYVFCFRELNDWLRSMYSHPHECRMIKESAPSFQDFISTMFWLGKQSREYDEKFADIIAMRKQKNLAYLTALMNWENTIGVNLVDLKFNPEKFLQIVDKFPVTVRPDHVTQLPHATDGGDYKTRPNRYQLTDDDEDLVDEMVKFHAARGLESAIKNMTYAYSIKGCFSAFHSPQQN